MTSDQARALFGMAYDGSLAPEDRRAFDTALAADPMLSQAYATYVDALRSMAQVDADATPTPDLLAGVQAKLHARSAGRFYRDRFARRAGLGFNTPLVWTLCMIGLLALGYWVLWGLPSAPVTAGDEHSRLEPSRAAEHAVAIRPVQRTRS